MSEQKHKIKELIKLMSTIGNHNKMTGEEKKQWVLNSMKYENLLNEEIEPLISEIIDYLILVDKNEIKINVKNIKKSYNYVYILYKSIKYLFIKIIYCGN